MTTHSNRHAPKLTIDLPAIAARDRAVTAAENGPQLAAALLDSAADVPLLLAELGRLWGHLLALRLDYANLRAAAQAALSAARDGEPDPFAYLTDELSGTWPAERLSTQDTR
jgi:hypothetical protein